jgi:hypothetical protein
MNQPIHDPTTPCIIVPFNAIRYESDKARQDMAPIGGGLMVAIELTLYLWPWLCTGELDGAYDELMAYYLDSVIMETGPLAGRIDDGKGSQYDPEIVMVINYYYQLVLDIADQLKPYMEFTWAKPPEGLMLINVTLRSMWSDSLVINLQYDIEA